MTLRQFKNTALDKNDKINNLISSCHLCVQGLGQPLWLRRSYLVNDGVDL
jgi:hypothetical protein